MKIPLFLIGADPEFAFMERELGNVVEACNIIRATHRFGLDGCDSVAELRPTPSTNPSQVVKNISQDLYEGYRSNVDSHDYYWKAGSLAGDHPIGGHIHFGIHKLLGSSKFNRDSRNIHYRRLLEYLNCYLAQVVRLLEDEEEANERIENYGFLGDYRPNAHGMEYRVLGSWLTSPRVAEGVLCLAQTIVYQYLWDVIHQPKCSATFQTPREFEKLKPTYEYDDENEPGGEGPGGEGDFSKSCKEYRKKFPRLQKHIRQFELYERYKDPIEFIFKLVEKKKTWFPGHDDMKIAWGITSGISRTKLKVGLPSVAYRDIWERAK